MVIMHIFAKGQMFKMPDARFFAVLDVYDDVVSGIVIDPSFPVFPSAWLEIEDFEKADFADMDTTLLTFLARIRKEMDIDGGITLES